MIKSYSHPTTERSDNMKYGIYVDNIRIWGMFKTQEQALDFIDYYDLTENPYEVKSYY